MEIKKGNKFLCIKDVVMFDGDVAYKKGEIYQSELHGCITDTQGDREHHWDIDDEDAPHIYFKPLAEVEQDEYSWVNNALRDVATKKTFNPKPYYDNSRGSLYKLATERGWNAYLFDLVKRLERGGKKDPLKQEIEKSIDVLKIWLNEID